MSASSLDNAARQKRGLGPEMGITGPIPVKVVEDARQGQWTPPPRVELDLTKAAIDGAIPGLDQAGRDAPGARASTISPSLTGRISRISCSTRLRC